MKTMLPPSKRNDTQHPFTRVNYLLLLLSALLIVLGLVLMSGPGSTPTHFEPDIFCTRRIVVAPIVCLAGYLLVFVAIMWRSRDASES